MAFFAYISTKSGILWLQECFLVTSVPLSLCSDLDTLLLTGSFTKTQEQVASGRNVKSAQYSSSTGLSEAKACKLHISIVHTSFFSTFLPLLEKCEKTCHLHPFRYERRKQKEEIPTRGIEPRPPRTWLCCDEETRYESEKS
jgi:hypothetical protein